MIEEILNKHYPKAASICNKYHIDYNAFVAAIANKEGKLQDKLGINATKTTKLVKEIFYDKFDVTKLFVFLLRKESLKYCGSCDQILSFSDFRSNNSNIDKLQSQCKNCHSKSTAKTQPQRQAKYRNSIHIPSWANMNAIKIFYDNCPEGYHIIPLQGNNVCGLHVETNLQYLTIKDNQIKGNRLIVQR